MKLQKRVSESVKRENVRKIEKGEILKSEVAKLYGISGTSVAKWVKKFGILPKRERIIIESESDYVALVEQKKKVKELERQLGQIYMENSYLKKILECAKEKFSIDFEKKFGTKH